MSPSSLDARFFDRMYATTDDPWHFATSAYEAAKYDATIAALAADRFTRGLEIGCSIGVLTQKLAARCATLVSVDINERALTVARERCKDLRHVSFERMTVPGEFPDGSFDLAVVSEVGYYWSDDDLARAIDRIAQSAAGGSVVLVHFLPKVEEYPRDGDSVHEAFLADDRFTRTYAHRAERYRIDVLRVR